MTSTEGEGGQIVTITNDAHVVAVRQAVRALAAQASLSLVDQTKVITAASELARNTLVYGGGGTAELSVVRNGARAGVQAIFVDHGPGIPNLELALTDGWTSGSGLGLGLSGSRRLVDKFDLHTEVGCGTRVVIVKWGR